MQFMRSSKCFFQKLLGRVARDEPNDCSMPTPHAHLKTLLSIMSTKSLINILISPARLFPQCHRSVRLFDKVEALEKGL